MPKFTTETNSVICVDEEYIDTNDIARITKVDSAVRNKNQDEDEHFFSVFFKGHSNALFFKGNDKLTALLKRKFIIDLWTFSGMDCVPTFNLEEAVEEFDEMNSDEDETDDDLN